MAADADVANLADEKWLYEELRKRLVSKAPARRARPT
jgi:hypothetical protein